MTATPKQAGPGPTYAVIRVRGHIDIRPGIKDTMSLLRLHRANHLVLVRNTPNNRGMLQKVKDYVTWGEVDVPTLTVVLRERGRFAGGVHLTDALLAERHAKPGTIPGLAEGLVRGSVRLLDVPGLKPVIRLHPPIKGWGRTKRAFTNRGVLGYRGAAINVLLRRMLGPELAPQAATPPAAAPAPAPATLPAAAAAPPAAKKVKKQAGAPEA